MGVFTIQLAQQVGNTGKVIAVDIQNVTLIRLARKLERAGIMQKLEPMLAEFNHLGVDNYSGKADSVLTFTMVHEIPDQRAFS